MFAAMAAVSMWAALGCSSRAAAETLRVERETRLLLPARINGQSVVALLDSAAEASVVDTALARRMGLRTAQNVEGRGSGKDSFEAGLVPGVTLEALGVKLTDQTIAVIDLTDIGQRLLGHPVDMILGRELFDAARLRIDIDAHSIAAISREHRPTGRRLELTTEHGIETVPVRVEDHYDARATFDLGNGSQVLISRAFAERTGLLRDGRAVTGASGGGLGGETSRQTFMLRSLEVAGLRLTYVPAAIDEQDNSSDVNIGVAVLRSFRITTDFSQHAVWLQNKH